MADNYLEKRYRDVFGSGSGVDPETGFSTVRTKKHHIPLKPAGAKKPVDVTGGKK